MNYKEFAIDVAKEAGKILVDNYGKAHSLDYHILTNFKIDIDRQSDRLIRQRIEQTYPNHNIYSEEAEGKERDSEFSWVIDPLDGTIPYRYGYVDHFSVCIALLQRGEPIIGVTYAPQRNELYVGEKGLGSFCNGQRLTVSTEENINHVVMAADAGKETATFKRASLASYIEKLYATDGVTYVGSFGCASVPLALTASGKMHAYLGLSLEPWDMAAGVILNREAGAKVTTVQGKEWELGDESILVANPKLHEKLLQLIKPKT